MWPGGYETSNSTSHRHSTICYTHTTWYSTVIKFWINIINDVVSTSLIFRTDINSTVINKCKIWVTCIYTYAHMEHQQMAQHKNHDFNHCYCNWILGLCFLPDTKAHSSYTVSIPSVTQIHVHIKILSTHTLKYCHTKILNIIWKQINLLYLIPNAPVTQTKLLQY